MRPFAERAAFREDAARLLGELGGTASEVAVSLSSMGIGGPPSTTGDSPIARYLNAIVGADTQVKRVRVTKRWLVLETHRRWGSTIWLRLPHPVREFTVSVGGALPHESTRAPHEETQA
jgi:hypothetical protein